MRKHIFLLIGLVVFITGLALPYAVADVKVVKFVNIVPLSGPAAPWGVAIARGHQMAADDIGVFTVAGQQYRWEIVNYDSKYMVADALSALNKAIFTENIRFGSILGAGIHPPLMPLIRENKFLDIASMAGGIMFTNPENPTIFRLHASTDELITTFFEEIYEIYKTKRVAIIAPNDEMGKADRDLLHKLHKERKVEAQIVSEEFYDRGMVDFYPALKRMLAKKVDLICTDGSPTGQVALIAKQSRELGFKSVIYNPTGVLEAQVLFNIAGKAADNILVPRIWAEAPTKKYSELERRYKEKYKEEVAALFFEIYPMIPWITLAMKEANTLDVEKLLPVFADTVYNDHPFGPASWGGLKHYGIKRQIVYPIPLSILEDGKWKKVTVKRGTFE